MEYFHSLVVPRVCLYVCMYVRARNFDNIMKWTDIVRKPISDRSFVTRLCLSNDQAPSAKCEYVMKMDLTTNYTS